MHRKLTRSVALTAAVAAGLGVAATANAASLDVDIPEDRQAQILDSSKITVEVDPPQSGTAKVRVETRRGGETKAVTKRVEASVSASGKRLAIKLTKGGRNRLGKCGEQDISADVRFKTDGGAESRKVARAALDSNLARCSVGSEDPDERPYYGPAIDTPAASVCDFLETSVCLQPWPNDYFTVADNTTETGRRLHLDPSATPQSSYSIRVDPTDFNRADGFSPGQELTVKVPGLDNGAAFDETGMVPITDLSQYDDADQSVVVINAETGERHPVWAELDQLADSDVDRNLLIRPAVNFEEGTRYIVALRNLKDAEGDEIGPLPAFRAYRDRLITDQPVIEDRRGEVEAMLGELQSANIPRSSLYLAWDFTVASADSLSGRVMAMREDAFDRLGDENLSNLTVEGTSPSFAVTEVTNYTPAENPDLIKRIRGTINTPCYLNQDGCPPGATFAWDNAADRTPNFNPAYAADVPFTCIVPRAVVDDDEIAPARPSLYGHGLLGSRSEVESGTGGNVRMMANEHNFVFCATDWAGMSGADAMPVVLPILNDVSNFPKLADRAQQGFINFMYLGRAMIHPNGLTTDPAFNVDPDGDGPEAAAPVIDTTRLFYDGNSQGGIMGGALTALSPDFERASLGVPGMNYSTLLQRSVDFDEYAHGIFGGDDTPLGLYDSYQDDAELPLLLSMMQMLWDRAEANGYAHHMTTDPLPDTPQHTVLMHLAFGDHQVANVAAEVEARTIGASVLTPALDPGRHWESTPFMGIPAISSFPFTGSAMVYWDGGPLGFDGTIDPGTATPPNGNVPPRETDGYGGDPHSYPRRNVEARQQKSDFLKLGGAIQGGCAGGNPCYANGWPGP